MFRDGLGCGELRPLRIVRFALLSFWQCVETPMARSSCLINNPLGLDAGIIPIL